MAKRLTDTEIWDQDWFIDLPNKYKILWMYMKDKCDQVGIWRPNKLLLQKTVGEPLNLAEFLDFVNIDKERIIVLPTGRWWLKSFFIFQYGETFSPRSNIHKGAIKALCSNGIHPAEILSGHIGEIESLSLQDVKKIAFQRGLEGIKNAFEGVEKGFDLHKDKDKDKDKEQEQDNSISKVVTLKTNKDSNTAAAAEKTNPKTLKPVESLENEIKEVANKVWKNQGWKESACISLKLKVPELKKWMELFNTSLIARPVPDLNPERYQAMMSGWVLRKKANGIVPDTGNHQTSTAPPLTVISHMKPKQDGN